MKSKSKHSHGTKECLTCFHKANSNHQTFCENGCVPNWLIIPKKVKIGGPAGTKPCPDGCGHFAKGNRAHKCKGCGAPYPASLKKKRYVRKRSGAIIQTKNKKQKTKNKNVSSVTDYVNGNAMPFGLIEAPDAMSFGPLEAPDAFNSGLIENSPQTDAMSFGLIEAPDAFTSGLVENSPQTDAMSFGPLEAPELDAFTSGLVENSPQTDDYLLNVFGDSFAPAMSRGSSMELFDDFFDVPSNGLSLSDMFELKSDSDSIADIIARPKGVAI